MLNNKDVNEIQALHEKSKEELITIILEFQKQIKELKEHLSQSPHKKEPPKFIKPTIHRYHHKPGQKPGHEGITRALAAHIDETIEQTLKNCPHCHNALTKPAAVIEHIQEDIIPAQVRVTKYRRYR